MIPQVLHSPTTPAFVALLVAISVSPVAHAAFAEADCGGNPTYSAF